MNDRFQITTLWGTPIEGIWKGATKEAKKFSVARIKDGPQVLHWPGGAAAQEMKLGSVVVCNKERSELIEISDSVQAFATSGYAFESGYKGSERRSGKASRKVGA